MSEMVPADQIEQIVGVERQKTLHVMRVVPQRCYPDYEAFILHSQDCLDLRKKLDSPLTECGFSKVLAARPLDMMAWEPFVNQPVVVALVAMSLQPVKILEKGAKDS